MNILSLERFDNVLSSQYFNNRNILHNKLNTHCMKNLGYSIAATLIKGEDLEWFTRFFTIAEVPLPDDGSRVKISCYEHEEFHFLVNDELVWIGIIPYHLQAVDVLIRGKQLPAEAMRLEKVKTPVIALYEYGAYEGAQALSL